MERFARLARHTAAELGAHGTNTKWWFRRLREWKNTPGYPLQYPRCEDVNIMDADWDTLLVLDACRYDLFEETVDMSRFDDYRRETSPGSATSEWSRYSFAGEYGDTVYVTGNPTTSRHVPGSFHRLVETWREGFDTELGTVPADHVTEAARDAHVEFPNKRLIVHYIQPHYPFVTAPDLQFTSWTNTSEFDNQNADDRARDVWEALGMGIVEYEKVWNAYQDNLRHVMESVEDLLIDLDGRAVITADHGNLLGERLFPIFGPAGYGHPQCRRHPDLITVPWAIVDGPRRRVVTGEVESQSMATDEETSQRLRALGYVD